jgi:hypothetical protein
VASTLHLLLLLLVVVVTVLLLLLLLVTVLLLLLLVTVLLLLAGICGKDWPIQPSKAEPKYLMVTWNRGRIHWTASV